MQTNKESMQKLKNDLYVLQSECELYSMYEKNMIADVFAQLMTTFEGVKYTYKFLYDENNNEKCQILEQRNVEIQKKFEIPIIKRKHNTNFHKYDEKEYFFLPPKYYSDNNNIKIPYLQDFIDYVFEKRINKKQETIDINTINEYLEEFTNKTKLNRFLVQNERQYNNKLRKESDDKIEFKKRSKVARKATYKAIVSILNDYENNDVTAHSYKKEYEYYNKDNGMITFILYDYLKIERIIKEFIHEEYVTEDTVPFIDQELKVIDYNMDTEIYFFDLKEQIESIQWDCVNLKKFLTKVEKRLKEKSTLDEDDINELYLEVINSLERNEKRKLYYL